MIKKLLFFSIFPIIFLLIAGCTAEKPQISLEISGLDLGEVVNGEIIKREIEVSNLGNATLEIEAVSTSCGCTTASLEPMTILPGDSGLLRIEVDSGAHGSDLTGEFIRQVFIASNDPENPEVVVEISAVILAR